MFYWSMHVFSTLPSVSKILNSLELNYSVYFENGNGARVKIITAVEFFKRHGRHCVLRTKVL